MTAVAIRSEILSAAWWKAAALRALYTALAIALPYIGGSLIADVPWITILSAAALGAILSLATSLAGLSEVAGVDLPWWLAALERVGKTFGQALVSGLVGATLLADVPWVDVLQASALAALASLLRLILATLPADPTIIDAGKTADGATIITTVPDAKEPPAIG